MDPQLDKASKNPGADEIYLNWGARKACLHEINA